MLIETQCLFCKEPLLLNYNPYTYQTSMEFCGDMCRGGYYHDKRFDYCRKYSIDYCVKCRYYHAPGRCGT